ncbi:MAG: MOSC domain-containing protein [Chloroflexota bacterium]|nr:MOSC domain-containing protein [Chloroflexota bacterium]
MQDQAGRVQQVSISGGGVPKLPVESAWVDVLGLDGDLHNDTKHHGGPMRAVCLYSLELLQKLNLEGHPAYPGSMGENLTVAGLDWDRLVPGARLSVGNELVLEVTSYTTPCHKIAGSFSDGRFKRVSEKVHPGESRVYARVLETGEVRPGDEVRLISDG